MPDSSLIRDLASRVLAGDDLADFTERANAVDDGADAYDEHGRPRPLEEIRAERDDREQAQATHVGTPVDTAPTPDAPGVTYADGPAAGGNPLSDADRAELEQLRADRDAQRTTAAPAEADPASAQTAPGQGAPAATQAQTYGTV